MNNYFLIIYFLFGFVFISSSIIVISVVLKAHISTGRADMLYLLAGFILIALAGVSMLMASALGLISFPSVIMPLVISILTAGFLLISYSLVER